MKITEINFKYFKCALIIALGLNLLPCNVAQEAKALAPFKLSASTNVIDLRLFGSWRATTFVIDSDCKYVQKGQKAKSNLRFRYKAGELKPEWHTNNWDLVTNRKIKLNKDDSFIWERDNKFIENPHRKWFARSYDQFYFNENDELVANSKVKQYLNGDYVGSYKTVSVLRKVGEKRFQEFLSSLYK